MDDAYWACENELCNRKILGGAAYCCTPCAVADENSYEIHDHTEGCDQRRSKRGAFSHAERYLYSRPKW